MALYFIHSEGSNNPCGARAEGRALLGKITQMDGSVSLFERCLALESKMGRDRCEVGKIQAQEKPRCRMAVGPSGHQIYFGARTSIEAFRSELADGRAFPL